MYKNTNRDECLICYQSMFKGFDIYRLLVNDSICYSCRNKVKISLLKQEFNSYPLLTFYKYESDISSHLIRYKDYLDEPLGGIFLKPFYLFINIYFKNYEVVLIPSSESMRKRRGFNHLREMLQDVKLPIYDCLEKSDIIQRFSENRNVSFVLKDKNLRFDKVIIFDDVITSGSSMQAAINVLAPISKEIVLISIMNNWNRGDD